jgi:hypothetical protein
MLVLPVIAIDVPRPLQAAWHASRGNGIRIAFVFLAIPWIAHALFQMLYPRGATWPQFIVSVVLAAMLCVTQVAATSYAYRAIRPPVPPPIDPPS